MRLNQTPVLNVQDFKDQPWLARLFVQLNPMIQQLGQLFDYGIDFSTNIKSVTQTYEVSEFQPIKIKWSWSASSPSDCRVISAYKGSDYTPCVLVAPWSYDNSTHQISISSLLEISSTGVSSASGRYKFTIRASI
jgi:hypothetical protein